MGEEYSRALKIIKRSLVDQIAEVTVENNRLMQEISDLQSKLKQAEIVNDRLRDNLENPDPDTQERVIKMLDLVPREQVKNLTALMDLAENFIAPIANIRKRYGEEGVWPDNYEIHLISEGAMKILTQIRARKNNG